MRIKDADIDYLLDILYELEDPREFLKHFLEDFYESGKVYSSVDIAQNLLGAVEEVEL